MARRHLQGNDNYYLEATSSSNPAAPLGGGTFGETWGTAAIAANTWTHLTATYDKTVLRLYVNGTLEGSRPRIGNIATSANPLQIGGTASSVSTSAERSTRCASTTPP
jgi:hypothetical protein